LEPSGHRPFVSCPLLSDHRNKLLRSSAFRLAMSFSQKRGPLWGTCFILWELDPQSRIAIRVVHQPVGAPSTNRKQVPPSARATPRSPRRASARFGLGWCASLAEATIFAGLALHIASYARRAPRAVAQVLPRFCLDRRLIGAISWCRRLNSFLAVISAAQAADRAVQRSGLPELGQGRPGGANGRRRLWVRFAATTVAGFSSPRAWKVSSN